LLWRLEWLACRAADVVIIDTDAHARYVEELFHLPEYSVGSLPVGFEAAAFPRLPAPKTRPRPIILFYGQLIPLHGIETVLEAALSERGTAYDWIIIGSGQEAGKVEAALGARPPEHVTWSRWVPYAELNDWIGRSDICLGIFGESRKAGSVVPNKVYQSLACGRHVITRESPAMDALAKDIAQGLTLVSPASSTALLDGIEQAVRGGCTPPPLDGLHRTYSPRAIGLRMIDIFHSLPHGRHRLSWQQT